MQIGNRFGTILLTFCFLFAALLTTTHKAAEASEKAILFGIVPQQSATRLAQIWIPLLTKLSAQTGLNIQFATTKDIPTFEKCLAQGAYEFAYMNPYHYVVFHETSGYQAFSKQKEKLLQGLIVVRKDNPAQSLKELSGEKFAFPSPGAFGASVLPRAEMRKNGIEHPTSYVRSHDSVYRSVAAGLFAAGGGVGRTFGNMDDAIKDQLRVVYRTEKYTPHAFAHSPKIDADTAKKVLSAMIAAGDNDPELLKRLGFKGFVTTTNEDWADVRGLNLTKSEAEVLQEGETACRSD